MRFIEQLLSHTPITALGINMRHTFRYNNDEDWHALGHRLAPKEPWGNLLNKPGMLMVQMKALRSDDYEGAVNVSVQSNSPREVIISVNDHYQVGTDNFKKLTLSQLLDAHRKISIENSQIIAKTLITPQLA
jgi:hypothetical protein